MTTPFCTVNGITIPTAKGGQVQNNELGQRTQAYDGSMQIDVRARKRVWTVTTKPITPDRAEAIKGTVQGNGLYFPFDSDVFASNGFAAATSLHETLQSNTAADGTTPVYDEFGNQMSKYGAASIQVDRGVTNLFTTVTAQCSSISGANAWTYTNATVSIVTSQFWEGTTSLEVVGGAGPPAWQAISPAVSVSSLTDYIVSGYIYATTVMTVTVELLGNNGGGGSKNITTQAGRWVRFTVSGVMAFSTTSAKLIVQATSSTGPAQTVFLDGLQLEVSTSSYTSPTAWQNPSSVRAAIDLIYDPLITNAYSGFTFACWIAGAYPSTSGNTQTFVNVLNSASVRIAYLELDYLSGTTSTLNWITQSVNGSVYTTSTTLTATQLGGWTHIIATCYANPPPSIPDKSLYVNGALQSSSTLVSPVNTSNQAAYEVGSIAGSSAFNGRLDDLLLLPFPVDAYWASGIYGAGQAYGPAPYMNLGGSMLNGYPNVLVGGEVPTETYTGFQDPTAAVWRSNSRVMNLTFTET